MSRTKRRSPVLLEPKRKTLKEERDGKSWLKPGKNFKRPRRQQERAKMEAAVKTGKDLPKIRHNDEWDWL